ncbi:hypothetical protein PGIGA_G00225070 [Pangasianodon gigas]|uniref:Uncharacterized protein n=1 Tax=Pangasianodon gigas TaxID=30993 RepID=A0ACC5WJB5_PANGG|nr:hypothetical protein [Pangasianodon gigas]
MFTWSCGEEDLQAQASTHTHTRRTQALNITTEKLLHRADTLLTTPRIKAGCISSVKRPYQHVSMCSWKRLETFVLEL